MPPLKKKFVISHLFETPPHLVGSGRISKTEEHYNILWEMSFYHENGRPIVAFTCHKPKDDTFCIKTRTSFYVKTENYAKKYAMNVDYGNISDGFVNSAKTRNLIYWNELQDRFDAYNEVTIEIHVEILEMIGFGEQKLRHFDERIKDLSDLVLIVEDQKFYVLRKFLSFQSSYFKALLMGELKESKQSKVELKDIDPEVFQNFLEVLHGEPAINDKTVEGILHLADMYDCPTVVRSCETFLQEKSKISIKLRL